MSRAKILALAFAISTPLALTALPAQAFYMLGYGCPPITLNIVGEENGFAVYEYGGGCTPEVAKEWSADLLEKAKEATVQEEIRVCSAIDGEVVKGMCISKQGEMKKAD